MIGGDGINDESNKMSPAPDTQIYLTKDTGFSPNAELANRMLVKAAETLPEGVKPLVHSD